MRTAEVRREKRGSQDANSVKSALGISCESKTSEQRLTRARERACETQRLRSTGFASSSSDGDECSKFAAGTQTRVTMSRSGLPRMPRPLASQVSIMA